VGIQWGLAEQEPGVAFRIGKTVTPLLQTNTLFVGHRQQVQGAGLVTVFQPIKMPVTAKAGTVVAGGPNSALKIQATPDPLLNSAFRYQFLLGEERSTFTCPHCNGKATVIGQRQQPKCTKCQRAFQADWQFCPADGTPRPPAPGAWRYCPLCGKRVELEKAAVQKR
jgi:hypothetical protein